MSAEGEPQETPIEEPQDGAEFQHQAAQAAMARLGEIEDRTPAEIAADGYDAQYDAEKEARMDEMNANAELRGALAEAKADRHRRSQEHAAAMANKMPATNIADLVVEGARSHHDQSKTSGGRVRIEGTNDSLAIDGETESGTVEARRFVRNESGELQEKRNVYFRSPKEIADQHQRERQQVQEKLRGNPGEN